MTDHDKLREAIKFISGFWAEGSEVQRQSRIIIAAAESTLPRTKMVEVWRVEWAERHHVTGDWLPHSKDWVTQEVVENMAIELRERLDCACIRVTGPHRQEVPA